MADSTRQDEMKKQVTEFHLQNPIVWILFEQFTFEIINRGFKNYSVNAVFERIRWERDIGGHLPHDGSKQFKLNNNYRAFYARRFMVKFPEHEGFFRTRIQTSGAKKATNLPEIPPSYFENETE